jgi:hypothetical protein
MAVELKSTGHEPPQIGYTAACFEDAITGAATEVVMVPFAGNFIAL